MLIKIKRIFRYSKKVKGYFNIKQATLLAKKMEESDNALMYFSRLQDNKLISKGVLWETLCCLKKKRSPIYDAVTSNVDDIELHCLVALDRALSSPSSLPPCELESFIEFYKEKNKIIVNESDYRRLLIALIIKSYPSSQSYDAFSKAGVLGSITIHQVLKVLNKASIEGEKEVFYNLIDQHSHGMTPAATVKVMYWECRMNNQSKKSYKSIEAGFCRLDKALSKDFVEYLLPLYRSIPEEKDMLDCHTNEKIIKKIKNGIEMAIQSHIPYSFVRLNDGEGYGFPNDLPCEFDVERQELHWWGEILDAELRNKIQKAFRESLQEYDLVGIPSVFRFIDEMSVNRDYSIFNNALLCRLFTLCNGYLTEYNGKAHITEGQINLYLFDKSYITRLASIAQRVVFISGAKNEYLQHVFAELQYASYIELPTHRLLKTEKFSYSEAAQSLPYVYEDYLEKIKELAGPGVVFFISAGFIGKIFAAEVSKNGGVALDVGQTLMNIVANHVDA